MTESEAREIIANAKPIVLTKCSRSGNTVSLDNTRNKIISKNLKLNYGNSRREKSQRN